MTPTPTRLELHMARGDDQVWHAWLYDPATDTILITAVADGPHQTLAELIDRDILPEI